MARASSASAISEVLASHPFAHAEEDKYSILRSTAKREALEFSNALLKDQKKVHEL